MIREFCHRWINSLGEDTDPDQYLQIPSRCAVDRQRQDNMGVCG